MLEELFAPVIGLYLHRERDRLFKRQQWKELAQVCRRLVALKDSDHRALNDLAVALFELRDHKEALKVCLETFKSAPKVRADLQFAAEGARYMRYLLIYAQALLRLGEFDRARRVLEPLKKMGKYFHEKYFLLSKLHEKEGRLSHASAELEEMQRLYQGPNSLWGAEIRARSQAVLERAFEKRDPDAALFSLRTIARSSLQSKCLQESLSTARGAPAGAALAGALEVCADLQEGRFAQARQRARGLVWPELEARFETLALTAEGRVEEAFALLLALPAESLFHLEQIQLLAGTSLAARPEYLRDRARCQLLSGHLEEALKSLKAARPQEKADVDASLEIQRLILERSIWRDEKILGGHTDPEEDLISRVLPGGPDFIELPYRGRPLRVRLPPSLDPNRPSEDEVGLRLAQNCLRAGTKVEAALGRLRDLSAKDSPLRSKAQAQAALHHIVSGAREAASKSLRRFRELAPAPVGNELRALYLELGDACEAAGLLSEAKALLEAVLSADKEKGSA